MLLNCITSDFVIALYVYVCLKSQCHRSGRATLRSGLSFHTGGNQMRLGGSAFTPWSILPAHNCLLLSLKVKSMLRSLEPPCNPGWPFIFCVCTAFPIPDRCGHSSAPCALFIIWPCGHIGRRGSSLVFVWWLILIVAGLHVPLECGCSLEKCLLRYFACLFGLPFY